MFLQVSFPPRRLSYQTFAPFVRTIIADTLQKVDDIHQATFFEFVQFCSFHFESVIRLFRLCPATNSFAIFQSRPCTHARTVNKLQRLSGDLLL